MAYKLTRWLYAADEVECSLMCALILKRDLRECYYWIYELYYSGLPAFDSLWKIFYDFYFENNPKLEGYMRRKAIAFGEGSQEALADIVRNMHRVRASPTAFLVRQYATSSLPATKIYRGRKPTWCGSYDADVVLLLRSIEKRHWENIAYYISRSIAKLGADRLFNQLVTYFAKIRGTELDDKIFEYWNERSHPDDMHYLIALIVHLCANEEDLNLRNIYVRPTKKDMDWIKNIDEEGAPISKYGHAQLYNMLTAKRLFGTGERLGAFQLCRHEFEKLTHEIWYHWEFHSRNTPLWKERMAAYCATFDGKEIRFPDDDKLEAFYELYGYEPDEQPHETQSKGIGDIASESWEGWFADVFQVQPIIVFPDNFRYRY